MGTVPTIPAIAMARAASSLSKSALLATLRRCRLLESLSAPDLARVASFTAIKAFGTGDYLFHQGSLAHGFFVVQKGAIKLLRVNPLGREQAIHVFRPVESFGEESLMSVYGYPADACATEPSQVLLVRREGFLDLLARRPELALNLMRAMDRHVHILIGLLDDMTLKDVKTRLANWLIQQCPDGAGRGPVSIRLPSTKRELAAELGAASETLSRTVAKLRDLKLVAVEGNTLTLLDPGRLRRLFGGGTRPPAPEAPPWSAPRSN